MEESDPDYAVPNGVVPLPWLHWPQRLTDPLSCHPMDMAEKLYCLLSPVFATFGVGFFHLEMSWQKFHQCWGANRGRLHSKG